MVIMNARIVSERAKDRDRHRVVMHTMCWSRYYGAFYAGIAQEMVTARHMCSLQVSPVVK